jgi:hypothetical protein
VALSVILVPIVSTLVGLIKTTAGTKLSTSYYPALSIFVGVILGQAIYLASPVPLVYYDIILAGGVAGFGASKLYGDAAANSSKNLLMKTQTESIAPSTVSVADLFPVIPPTVPPKGL